MVMVDKIYHLQYMYRKRKFKRVEIPRLAHWNDERILCLAIGLVLNDRRSQEA